jgi:hypothetical protein
MPRKGPTEDQILQGRSQQKPKEAAEVLPEVGDREHTACIQSSEINT